MKWTRHSPEQIIAKLREADALLATGATIALVVQKRVLAVGLRNPGQAMINRRHRMTCRRSRASAGSSMASISRA
jgi:hypothetical protein